MASGLAASRMIMRLTRLRALHSRGFWVSLALLVAPVLLAQGLTTAAGEPPDAVYAVGFELLVLLLAVIPPLMLASAVADEIESQTYTYLWSRPLPRWALVTGKLWALGPLIAVLLAACAFAVYVVAYRGGARAGPGVLLRGLVAVAGGGVATGMVALGVGCLLPRHSMPAAIAYLLLLDFGIGKLPFAVNTVSISNNVRVVAGLAADSEMRRAARMIGVSVDANPWLAAAWIAGLGAVWLAIALLRVTRAEYARLR